MSFLKQLIPYSSLIIGCAGIALMIVPLTDSRIVANFSTPSLMSLSGICSLFGMVIGNTWLVRHSKPRWAGVLPRSSI